MDPKDLLATIRAEFLRTFNDSTQKVIPRCIEDLFKKADASYSSSEQRRLLNARAVLQEQGVSLTQQMSKNMEFLLTRSFQTTYNTYRPVAALSLNASSLSLVDVTAFEDELRIDDVTKRFRNEAEEQLRDLNIRIALLFDQDVIKERENPFRPYLFSRCITTSVEDFGFSPDLAASIIEQLTEKFVSFIAPIYNSVNTHLAKHGIAAQLQFKIKKSPTQAAIAPQALDAEAAFSESEQQLRNNQINDVDSASHDIDEQYQESNSKSWSAVTSRNKVDQLLETVRGMASEMTGRRPMVPPTSLASQMQAPVKAEKQSGWLGGGQAMGGVLRKFFGGGNVSDGADVSAVFGNTNPGGNTSTMSGRTSLSVAAPYSSEIGNPTGSYYPGSQHSVMSDDYSEVGVGRMTGVSRSTELSGGSQSVGIAQLASSVQGMQKAYTSTTIDMFDSQGAVRNLILEQRAALNEMTENIDELMTIDIVAMLFEFILRDTQVPAEVRAQLGRLQFMVLKIALRDTTLLTQKGHPARMLVNRIGSISLGLKQLDPSGVQITEEICRIVETLLQDDSEHPQLFSKMLDEFDAFIARELRAGDKNVERAVEAVERLQNRTLRFAHTAAQMGEALSGLTIDPYLQEFLQDTWVLAVELADRRDVKMAGRYRLLVPDLLWSIVPKLKEDDRTQLFALLPIILNTLREGLGAIEWDAARQKELMNWLVDAHTSALRGSHSATLVYIPSLPAIHEHFNNFVNTPEASLNFKFDNSKLANQKNFLEESIKELDIKVRVLDQVFEHELSVGNLDGGSISGLPSDLYPESIEDRLRSGVAMEINLGGKSSQGRLKWVDPTVSNLILSLEGQDQPSMVSVRMFRRMIAHGRVRFLESEPLFERAVQSLLKSADSIDKAALV